jgi:hypothetical protein
MKTLVVLPIMLALCLATVRGEYQFMICGDQPGEIYLTSFHHLWEGYCGFYYSSDYGEHVELRDSMELGFGALLADAAENTLHRFRSGQYFSTDGGFSWTLVDTTLTRAYASGVIPGEIYRRMDDDHHRLERSENYGADYTPCIFVGFPDSVWIYSGALGVDSGEVFIWGYHGLLYYSDDFGETITFLGDLRTTWGVNQNTHLINGAELGEVYIFHHDSQRIWRASDYADTVALIANFDYLYWFYGIAASQVPGELYFVAQQADMVPGGVIHLYHTTDYFQTWTRYVPIIEWQDVDDEEISNVPSSITVQIWPNPANAVLNISYELNAIQSPELILYNMLGRKVWQHNAGMQSPGRYLLQFADDRLPSGRYFLQLNTDKSSVFEGITIVK